MNTSTYAKSILTVVLLCVVTASALPDDALAETSKAAPTTETKRPPSITSQAELDQVVARLEQPATRLQALAELIEFALEKIYQTGGMISSSGNRALDDLQEQAAAAILKDTDFETVSQALDSPNRTLQFWGIWSWRSGHFKSRNTTPNIWLSLMPKVKNLAVNGDAGVRLEAVEGLQGYAENISFLKGRIDAETSPSVLLRLLYGGNGVGLSERFNPLLLRLLNHPDKAVRIEALGFIAWNYNSAPMWQIKFDKPIADKVLAMTKSASAEESKDALFALEGMQKPPLHN